MSVVYKSFEEEFTARLMAHQDFLLDAIGGGNAQDWGEYKSVCGKLDGVKDSHEIFMELVRKYNESTGDK